MYEQKGLQLPSFFCRVSIIKKYRNNNRLKVILIAYDMPAQSGHKLS